jgi:hypothetical protein
VSGLTLIPPEHFHKPLSEVTTMQRILLRSVLVLGLVAGGLAGGSRLAGQEPPRPALPRAEDLLDRAAAAAGSKEAFQKVKTIVLEAKVSVQDMRIGSVVYHAGPRKHRQEVTREGLGKTEVVVCGDLAWVTDTITGSRFLKGAERAQVFREVEQFARNFQGTHTWRQEYRQVRTVAEENVDGKPAYKVRLTTQAGAVVINHYDKASGLLVRHEKTVDSPQGKRNVVEFYSDYRNVDGILHPFAGRIVEGAAEVRVTIERIEHNVDIPEERFTPPAALAKRHKQR